MVVSIEATPVEPIIDYEIMTIEVDNEVVGTKLMFDASSSKRKPVGLFQCGVVGAGGRWLWRTADADRSDGDLQPDEH